MDLTSLKRIYNDDIKPLCLETFETHPIDQLTNWFKEFISQNISNCNAMTLSTCNKKGHVSSRTLLLKYFDHNGLLFFSHYNSHKGIDLNENPSAAMTFFWQEVNRQVCIEGEVTKTSIEESTAYFHLRPRDSQIVTWSSEQDKPISSRQELKAKITETEKQFIDKEIPLPSDWGGYRLTPKKVEFWQGGPGRLNDRFYYSLKDTQWNLQQLSP